MTRPTPRAMPVTYLWVAVVGLLVAGAAAALTWKEPDDARPATAGELAMLANAARDTGAVSSARMRFRFEVSGGGQELASEMEGVMGEGGLGRFTVELPEQVTRFGAPRTLVLATDGAHTFLQVPEDRRPATAGKAWVRAPLPASSALESTGLAPQSALELLARDSIEGSPVSRHADREIRGVTTQHYRVLLDLDKLASRGPAAAGPFAALPPGASRELPLSAFIVDDGIVRRLDVDYRTDGMTMRSTFELFDLGAPADIAVPSVDESFPVPDLQAMFALVGLPAAGAPTAPAALVD